MVQKYKKLSVYRVQQAAHQGNHTEEPRRAARASHTQWGSPSGGPSEAYLHKEGLAPRHSPVSLPLRTPLPPLNSSQGVQGATTQFYPNDWHAVFRSLVLEGTGWALSVQGVRAGNTEHSTDVLAHQSKKSSAHELPTSPSPVSSPGLRATLGIKGLICEHSHRC